MKTDRVDIMHLHSCPADTLQNSGVVEALVAAKTAGKVRAVAYSGENEDRAYALSLGVFDVIQTSVNICDQRVIEEFLPRAVEHNVGVIAKRPLANAFWRFSSQPVGDYSEVYWVRNQAMGLDPSPLEWAEYALRFTAFQPGVHTCIAGTSNLQNLTANMNQIAKGPLRGEMVTVARERFRECDTGWVGQI